MISTKRLFLDKSKKKVVADGDKDAAFLLVGVGGVVPVDYRDKVKSMGAAENKEKKTGEDKGKKSGLTVNTKSKGK